MSTLRASRSAHLTGAALLAGCETSRRSQSCPSAALFDLLDEHAPELTVALLGSVDFRLHMQMDGPGCVGAAGPPDDAARGAVPASLRAAGPGARGAFPTCVPAAMRRWVDHQDGLMMQ